MDQHFKEAIVSGESSLGIEFGSTRIKAALINKQFEIIASSSYEWENQLIGHYWTYHQREMVRGLQDVYGQLKQQVMTNYGVKLQKIGAIGCSGMMQGYIVLDESGELLVPFRTWRNATTSTAATCLTRQFQFKIPERWSIAHLYQAILNNEEHVKHIKYITTLSGYMHFLLTGSKAIGAGDASGMFPIDRTTCRYNEKMLAQFNELISENAYSWHLEDILPSVLTAGEHAGYLHEAGARLIDPSGDLQAGIPFCPRKVMPERAWWLRIVFKHAAAIYRLAHPFLQCSFWTKISGCIPRLILSLHLMETRLPWSWPTIAPVISTHGSEYSMNVVRLWD